MLLGIIASALQTGGGGGTTYEDEITALSPIVRWKLDEASGATSLADSVGSFDFDTVSNLTFEASPLLNDSGFAIDDTDADGSGQKDISGTHVLSDLGAASDDYSIAAWLKGALGGNDSNSLGDWWGGDTALELRQAGSSGTHVPFNLSQDNGKFAFRRSYNRFSGSEGLRGGVDINDGDPHFCVAVVESGGTVRLYVDGVEDVNGSMAIGNDASVGTNSSYLSLFARSTDNGGRGNNKFDGILDDVAIFDYALTAQQVSDLYDAGKIPEQAPQDYDAKINDLVPSYYWKMAETSGTVAADETNTQDGSYEGSPTLGLTALFSELNTCVEFNGSNQWVNMGNINVDGFTQKSVVVAVAIDDVNSDQIIVKEGGAGNGFGLGITGGNLAVGINSGSTGVDRAEYSVSNLSNGTSYLIVGTIDTVNDRLELYVNGSLVASNDVSLGGHNGSCQFNLAMTGCDNSASNFQNPLTGTSEEVWFDGKMSNFAAFDYILTGQQVSDLYDYAIGVLP